MSIQKQYRDFSAPSKSTLHWPPSPSYSSLRSSSRPSEISSDYYLWVSSPSHCKSLLRFLRTMTRDPSWPQAESGWRRSRHCSLWLSKLTAGCSQRYRGNWCSLQLCSGVLDLYLPTQPLQLSATNFGLGFCRWRAVRSFARSLGNSFRISHHLWRSLQ